MRQLYCYLLFIAAMQVVQASPESSKLSNDVVDVWLYATYTPRVTHGKVVPFFEAIYNHSGLASQITATTDMKKLIKSCQSGPDLVLANPYLGSYLRDDCQYEVIAKSRNAASLFAKQANNVEGLGRSPAIGYVEANSVIDIARNELGLLIQDVDYKQYDTAYTMIRALVRGEIVAFIAGQDSLKATGISKAWFIIHNFDHVQEEWVMTSPRLDDSNKQILQTAFVTNTALGQQVWHDGFGYGEFIVPHNQP